MPRMIDLLGRGYFSEHLPPTFISDIYAKAVTHNLASLPKSFFAERRTARAATHSVARVELLRRPLGIPNPILFFNLSNDIVSNWKTLAAHFSSSKISCTAPVVDARLQRAIWWATGFDDQIPLRARLRATSKWILRTDIAKFYPSVYTHSIPWALHGKTFAKTNRGYKHLGNSLDRWVRNAQDGQTLGVPIGPDTSFVIAEIILTAVDRVLQAEMPTTACIRRVDDYEFGAKSYAQAEQALATLQGALKQYELDVNFAKTAIIELPLPIEPTWVSELRQYMFRDKPTGQHTDLIQYFSRAFELSAQNQGDSVLKYAIKRLREVVILNPENWSLLESFLLQCISVEAGTIQAVLELLIDYNHNKHPVALLLVREVLLDTIRYACPLGYTNETAWAIWGMIHWQLSLDEDSARAIERSTDTVVALLALDALKRKLMPKSLDLQLWQSFMTTADLYGEQWLLSYEANRKSWLPSLRRSADHVNADPSFGYLKGLGVYFYDETRFTSAKIPRVYTEYERVTPSTNAQSAVGGDGESSRAHGRRR